MKTKLLFTLLLFINFSLFSQVCLPVSNITATIPGTNLIELSWTENNNPPATIWQVGIVTQGASIEGSFYNVNDNPHLTDGVIAGQNYDIYIRPVCDVNSNIYGDWTIYEIRENTSLTNEAYCGDNPNNYIDLDLSLKDTEVLDGDSPNDFTISYFLDVQDANANVNALPSINQFLDTTEVYVRKENNNTSDYEIFSYTITVHEFVYAFQPSALENCQDEFVFNLFSKNQEVIGNQIDMSVSYHLTQSDAENGLNPLSNNYTVNNSQLVYVRVSNQITGCSGITTLMLDFITCEDTYTVNPLPYQMYIPDFDVQTINTDDRFSESIDLTFSFKYFNTNYSNLSIADNGVISFEQTDAGAYCPWNLSATQIPNEGIIDNAILGIYQDVYNPNQAGTLGFGVTGTAPFRKFLAIYDNLPLYQCQDIFITNQVVLYESYNFIDVQVKDRNVCTTWNNGRAILGIQNIGGTDAYFPPNRNTGDWEAHNEAWRFRPMQEYPEFQYIICDANVDGFETFDLNVIINHFNDGSGHQYSLFETEDNATNNVNEISGSYTNLSNTQTIYLRDYDGTTATIKSVLLAAIDCSADYDVDNVPTSEEDLNANGNFGDDDTDGDAIPDFIDDDDDGDYVLTNVEAINTRNSQSGYQDTDGDQTPDYLDNDDDGDMILTLDEDINENYILSDDDTDGDNIPNYLDNEALSVNTNELGLFSIYPNPAKNILTIETFDVLENTKFSIYSLQGSIVSKKQILNHTKTEVDISNLSVGVYFIKLENDKQVTIKKFVKK